MPAGAVSLTSAFVGQPVAGPARRCSRQQQRRVSRAVRVAAAADSNKEVWLLDYGAGNVRSVRNAIKYLGYNVRDVRPAFSGTVDRHLRLSGPGIMDSRRPS